jgi:nucleotide-binding universal stress UspA family protein
VIADRAAVDGILAVAKRFRAGVIVLGGRGHGAVRRMLVGSVSRDVARHTSVTVLVVPHQPKQVRSLVVAFDGSSHARRAAAFVARLEAPPRGRITFVRVVEPMATPRGAGLPRGVQAELRREVVKQNAALLRQARRSVNAVAAGFRARGWTVQTVVRAGVPLKELLAAVDSTGADVLVLGARGVGGLRRLLLGSVADGALNLSPVPVLVVR